MQLAEEGVCFHALRKDPHRGGKNKFRHQHETTCRRCRSSSWRQRKRPCIAGSIEWNKHRFNTFATARKHPPIYHIFISFYYYMSIRAQGTTNNKTGQQDKPTKNSRHHGQQQQFAPRLHLSGRKTHHRVGCSPSAGRFAFYVRDFRVSMPFAGRCTNASHSTNNLAAPPSALPPVPLDKTRHANETTESEPLDKFNTKQHTSLRDLLLVYADDLPCLRIKSMTTCTTAPRNLAPKRETRGNCIGPCFCSEITPLPRQSETLHNEGRKENLPTYLLWQEENDA